MKLPSSTMSHGIRGNEDAANEFYSEMAEVASGQTLQPPAVKLEEELTDRILTVKVIGPAEDVSFLFQVRAAFLKPHTSGLRTFVLNFDGVTGPIEWDQLSEALSAEFGLLARNNTKLESVTVVQVEVVVELKLGQTPLQFIKELRSISQF